LPDLIENPKRNLNNISEQKHLKTKKTPEIRDGKNVSPQKRGRFGDECYFSH
jgi:hypothetical protein